jgi:hypothetical protein
MSGLIPEGIITGMFQFGAPRCHKHPPATNFSALTQTSISNKSLKINALVQIVSRHGNSLVEYIQYSGILVA